MKRIHRNGFLIVCVIIGIIIEVSMLFANISAFASISTGVFVMLFIYLFFYYRINRRFVGILDEKCDPVDFIEKCEKYKDTERRRALLDTYDLNIAVGYLSLNHYDKASVILESLEMKKRYQRTFKIAYHLARLCVYLNNDDMEKAASEYACIKELRKKIYVPRIILSTDVTCAEYFYKLNKTAETKKYFLEQLNYIYNNYSDKASKRQRLGIIYARAVLSHELGDYDDALKKYKFVAEKGNRLWIAENAKAKIAEIEAELSKK